MSIDMLELPMPLTVRPHQPITDEELIRFSERNRPYRIEVNKQGEIVIMTPVGAIGGNYEFVIGAAFARWMENGADGIAFSPSTGFRLSDGSCLSPDGSWMSSARWNSLTTEQQKSFPPLAPDFLIEVRSQSDSRRDLEAKMQLWLDNGAQLAWLVDPIDASVTIYRPNHQPETLDRPTLVRGEGPIEGFELRCNRLWPAP